MRYGKVFLTLFTAVLLTAAILAGIREAEDIREEMNTKGIFSIRVYSGSGVEELRCWERAPGEFYVFLPGYAELDRAAVSMENGREIEIGGLSVEDGMLCDVFQLNTDYPITYGDETGNITFLRSGNVPTMYIDLASGSLSHIHASKENEESGKLRLYDAQGTLDHGGSLEAMSGRGNSTWDQEKKPYNLKLSAQADLLGMGAAKKWILLANITDRSHLRNMTVLDFAREAGLAYTPESRWVDLYVNGEYQGLYQLCERNEIHPQRISEPEDSTFLVSVEVLWRLVKQNYPHFVTGSNTALRVHQGENELEALREKWQSIENAILAEDGIDPVTGKYYLELIDLDSWVRKFLVEEIFGNGDASALSQFFYGSIGDGKVYAGPVWDYDVSMGLDIWQMAVPNVFYANRPYLRKGVEQNWFHSLYQKPEFYDRMVELYTREMRPMLVQRLETGIRDYARQVLPAAEMNQYRWKARSAAEETEKILAYLTRRMAFLDGIWLENREYCMVTVDLANGANAACFVISPGERVPLLPEYEEDGAYLGWYDLETDMPFDPAQPIYEDRVILRKRAQTQESYEEPEEEAVDDRFLQKAAPVGVLLLILLGTLAADRKKTKELVRQ